MPTEAETLVMRLQAKMPADTPPRAPEGTGPAPTCTPTEGLWGIRLCFGRQVCAICRGRLSSRSPSVKNRVWAATRAVSRRASDCREGGAS